ncbi:MAG: TIGR03862 family flavoprotein [Pseudomonadota bacterium]
MFNALVDAPFDAVVVGAGPAGLMAAQSLGEAGLRVAICERMERPGRKFLMAGRGGLNLTHSEPLAAFLTRYGEAAPWLTPIIEDFPPADVLQWAHDLGQQTFVGSSGRVFPKAMKASGLLRAWLRHLDALGGGDSVIRGEGAGGEHEQRAMQLFTGHTWLGFDHIKRGADGKLSIGLMNREGTRHDVRARVAVIAVGGASWPRLGSDGAWRAGAVNVGLPTAPFAASNCGFTVPWSAAFAQAHAGAPLKRMTLSVDGTGVRGEALVTRQGLEGGAVYALGPALRAALNGGGEAARIRVDLRPDLSHDALAARLAKVHPKKSTSTRLRQGAGLSQVAVALLREAATMADERASEVPSLPRDAGELAARIKACTIVATGPFGLARAISSTGGLAPCGLDPTLMVTRMPGVFAAGEMIDWDAPTGGYLLQACFATGRWAGRHAARYALATSVEPQVT